MNQELTQLIKMANQIAAHCAPGEPSSVAADRAANHLARFWAPSMRLQIKGYLLEDGGLLDDTAKDAVSRLG
jgi:hypothetical protein